MLKLNKNGDLVRDLEPRLGVHSVPYLGVIATAAELKAAGLVQGEMVEEVAQLREALDILEAMAADSKVFKGVHEDEWSSRRDDLLRKKGRSTSVESKYLAALKENNDE